MRATFTQDQLDIEKSVRSISEDETASARDALTGPWAEPACDSTLLRDFGLLVAVWLPAVGFHQCLCLLHISDAVGDVIHHAG